ncbi:MAG: patatin family protein [Oscillospiraceae bacterium]
MLEGGGMRGLFTAGILDFFLDNGIQFKSCMGVSAGAAHASSYVCGQSGRARDVSVDYLDDKNYCGLYSLLTTGNFFNTKMVYRTIPQKYYPLNQVHFDNSLTAFYGVVTNCDTGEPEYLRIADVNAQMDVIRASASLPLLSHMVEIGGKRYLDGGMADSIPLEKSIAMGNAKNVVVLTQALGYQKKPDKLFPIMKVKYRKYPELLAAMQARPETYNRSLEKVAELEKKGEVFVLRPKAPLAVGRLEKDRGKLLGIYELGYQQAEQQGESLLNFLSDSQSGR